MSYHNKVNIRTSIRGLRKEKKKWLKESFTAAGLRRLLNFKESEIEKIKVTVKYGKKRYLRQDVLRFLEGDKKRFNIFIAFDTKQTSFIPPVGKHRQGKLAIKH